MKTFKITKESLQTGISVVEKTASKKGVIPILGNILLTIGETLTLATTNLEMTISCEVPLISASEEFSTTIPAKLFSDLINAITGDELELEYDEKKLSMRIQAGKSDNNIRCLSPKDFPDIPKFPEESIISLPSENFRRMIQRSAFSAATSDTAQPLYAGINFEVIGDEMAITSTNGFRFSVEKATAKCSEFSVTIPATYANEVARVSLEDVEFAITENSILFRSGSVVCSVLTLDGKYPKLRDFDANTEGFTKVKVDTVEFYRAVKHASLFCDDDKHTLFLNIKLLMEISAQADQVGDSVVSIFTEVDGECEIHMNADYLADFLSVTNREKVIFFVGSKTKPVVFRMEGNESYFHVIMPIQPPSSSTPEPEEE